mmetsp:Transcript_76466/g.155180  ORF Transcript_76466/g.155180 Transcript_76466/m.155180 type:complete len:105 (+) Transcript_76466:576-890(+)
MFPAVAAPSGAQLCIIQAKSDWYWHMVEIIVRVVDAKLFGPMPAAASFNAEVAFSRPEQVLKQSEGGCKLWHSDKMRSVEKNHGNFIKLLEINSMNQSPSTSLR